MIDFKRNVLGCSILPCIFVIFTVGTQQMRTQTHTHIHTSTQNVNARKNHLMKIILTKAVTWTEDTAIRTDSCGCINFNISSFSSSCFFFHQPHPPSLSFTLFISLGFGFYEHSMKIYRKKLHVFDFGYFFLL